MARRTGRSGRDKAPPQNRTEGALRIARYLRWLYGPEVRPETLAGPLIDTALEEIAAIADPSARQKYLREMMDRAYSGLQDTE